MNELIKKLIFLDYLFWVFVAGVVVLMSAYIGWDLYMDWRKTPSELDELSK